MLQRAASNAYSWWWASHIRTKQSKWLDNNLQDMEDKVRGMLKLIEEDADTFAKKAEMYFRRRPELINFVEESYKSYRALAERYDHLSGELQKANNTIATVFPDQVHFGMDEDDDDQSPKSTAVDLSRCQKPSLHPIPNNNDCTTTTTTTAVVIGNKDVMVVEKPKHENTHHSSDETAKEEMSAIQKEILALQTEREFVKCSYEIGLTKYWGIEKKISELQEKVCSLQDECCADVVIEDDEARALMAVSALTSCQDTLLNLHDHQKRSTEEARKESQRIENAKQKLRAIRGEDGPPQPVDDDNEDSDTDVGEYLEEVCSLDQTGLELRSAREKARKNFEMNSETSILDLADKINELVNKVIELESTLSSQTSQIQRLRLENDELQKNLLHLEERKITCDDTKDMGDKLRQAEEELRKVEDIHRCVRDESIMLRTRFNEACGTFRVLSDTLQSPEQQHTAGSSEERDGTPSEHEADHVNQQNSEPPKQNHPTGNDGVKAVVERPTDLESDVLRENINIISVDDQNQDVADHGPKDAGEKSEENPEAEDEVDGKDTSQQNHRSCINVQESRQVSSKHTPTAKVEEPRKEDEDNGMHPSEGEGNFHANNDNHGNDDCHSTPNWQQLFLNGLEDREKVLLAEYTSILRNFKEIKKKLAEAEKKNQENMFETMAQVTKLKNTIVMRDDEIRSLRQQLTFLEADRNQHAGSHMPQQSQSSSTDLTNYDEISDEPNSQERKDENEHMDGMVETKRTDEASQGMDLLLIAEPCATSETEEKFRTDIDELLEENLEFWLRFSSSFQQIQKYQMAVQEIQAEMPKLKYGRRQEGGSSCSREHSMKPEPNSSKEEGGPSSNREQPMKSELRNSKNLEGGGSPSRAKPVKPEVTRLYKQLNDLDTDLSVWIEQNALLNEELQRRFSSLCNVKEEILTASQKRGMEGKEVALSTYQASKFQGEVLNMLQENNKVADELQAGMDHVKGLQAEVQQALARLKENFEFSGSKGHNHNHFRNFSSRARIPLRSFLFISKTKKKPSLFSCVNPIMQKQHSDLTVVIPQ